MQQKGTGAQTYSGSRPEFVLVPLWGCMTGGGMGLPRRATKPLGSRSGACSTLLEKAFANFLLFWLFTEGFKDRSGTGYWYRSSYGSY